MARERRIIIGLVRRSTSASFIVPVPRGAIVARSIASFVVKHDV